ncbi:hypothetical protein B0P06_000591 [Clostridium saccharoperbutylacetonicum]|uniref:Uncharacterized protein n=1 Tax=Clostridium saccharoperbutylacetonicum N1-4(HMT) TaxID=931276 RepID=M1MG57_9CLOT|nr:hypothetical protein Cspa_c15530 [Clostridium saccharoperbutylacetonicum N1-4(HMT)]AQR94209.1 hypothetical protein CLSAP_15160 [Clostridium saccharoperbutylacetonicum]NRT63964.1 hypothetical protein [Clostridium saccharoperbutylacetonicum]NSB27331.1 hypothetical protein [Clostridium saccharoperbutylacetonicum]NSB29909.1 hypothetical protein [Clostridium saccharoperbutylacetonicum]
MKVKINPKLLNIKLESVNNINVIDSGSIIDLMKHSFH